MRQAARELGLLSGRLQVDNVRFRIAGDMGVVSALIFAVIAALVEARPSTSFSDGCDWVGSGLDHPNQEHGVQPVYLRCSQGTVLWRWPRGALRLVLRLGSAGRQFRGCIQANDPAWPAGRVYLEGERHLHLLFSSSDGRPSRLPRCFNSRHGQAALYIEADAVPSSPNSDKASFTYDLQPVRPTSDQDPLEECRPCTDNELLHNFCVSDFVAKGIISSVFDNEELEKTEIKVKVHRVVRDASTPIFRQSDVESNQIRGQYSTLHVPSKCHVRHGEGDFIFMGRMYLGEPRLRCAPRISEWDRLKEQAIRTGRSQCTLE